MCTLICKTLMLNIHQNICQTCAVSKLGLRNGLNFKWLFGIPPKMNSHSIKCQIWFTLVVKEYLICILFSYVFQINWLIDFITIIVENAVLMFFLSLNLCFQVSFCFVNRLIVHYRSSVFAVYLEFVQWNQLALAWSAISNKLFTLAFLWCYARSNVEK